MICQDGDGNWINPGKDLIKKITGKRQDPSPLPKVIPDQEKPADLILRLTPNESFQVIDTTVDEILGVIVRGPPLPGIWFFVQATTNKLSNDQHRTITRIEEVLNLSTRRI